jgi:hypothetical protein
VIYRKAAEHLLKDLPKCKRCGAAVENAKVKVAAMVTYQKLPRWEDDWVAYTIDEIASPVLCDECRKPRESAYPGRPLCR